MTIVNERPEDAVLRQHEGQPVILFAEIHTLSDVVLDAAIAVAERTGKPLGLETLYPSKMPVVDALRAGEISKEIFLRHFTDQTAQKPQPGTTDDYLGKARSKKKWENLADAILRGVEVVPLGSSIGNAKGVPKTVESAEILDQFDYLGSQLSFKAQRFFKGTEAFGATSEKYYEDYATKVLERLDGFSEAQIKAFAEVINRRKRHDDDFSAATMRIYEITQPEWLEQEKLLQRMRALAEKKPDPLAPEFRKDYDPRMAGDPVVARKVKQQIDSGKDGMVVVYGASHTVHNTSRAGDIDSNLRKSGIPVLIVDVRSPSEVPHCAAVCKNVSDFFEMRVMQRNFEAAVKKDKDPDRISVVFHPPVVVPEIDGKQLKKDEPVILNPAKK